MAKLLPGQPGNGYGGKPRGARNRLAGSVFRDVLAFWDEPVKEGATMTKGQAAFLNMWREKPTEFVKVVAGLMPKEYVFESAISELDDTELDRMIEMLRARALEAREQQPMKVISHDAPERTQ
jgi:hypothetical protein